MSEIITLVIDETRILASGAKTTRIVGYDIHGCEVAWFGIDEADDELAPTAEYPDASALGWPEGYAWTFGVYNNVDESWGAPSFEAAIEAVLYEHADRIDSQWYASGSGCRHED